MFKVLVAVACLAASANAAPCDQDKLGCNIDVSSPSSSWQARHPYQGFVSSSETPQHTPNLAPNLASASACAAHVHPHLHLRTYPSAHTSTTLSPTSPPHKPNTLHGVYYAPPFVHAASLLLKDGSRYWSRSCPRRGRHSGPSRGPPGSCQVGEWRGRFTRQAPNSQRRER